MADITSTIKSLRTALAQSPKNVPLRLHLARTFEENGLTREACDEYIKVGALDPSNDEATLGAGRTLFIEKEFDAARKNFERVDCAESSFYLAKIFLAQGALESARRSYEHAIRLDGSFKEEALEVRLKGEPIRVPVGPGRARTGFDVESPSLKFNDVAGLDELKKDIRLKIIAPYERSHLFKAYGKSAGGGIILWGPPGCGKTLIAKATAGEVKADFMSLEIADVLDMWRGESERKLKEFFAQARSRAPCVVFIDELDALGAKRTAFHSAEMSSMVNQFLTEMDGFGKTNSQVLFLGATNMPWRIDSALRRPGRFEKMIFVPPPDQEARVQLLRICLKDKPVKNIDVEGIASLLEGYSGADITQVIEQAMESVLTKAMESDKIIPITTEDLRLAVKKVPSSVKEWFYTIKNFLEYANQSGMYDEARPFLEKYGIR